MNDEGFKIMLKVLNGSVDDVAPRSTVQFILLKILSVNLYRASDCRKLFEPFVFMLNGQHSNDV